MNGWLLRLKASTQVSGHPLEDSADQPEYIKGYRYIPGTRTRPSYICFSIDGIEVPVPRHYVEARAQGPHSTRPELYSAWSDIFHVLERYSDSGTMTHAVLDNITANIKDIGRLRRAATTLMLANVPHYRAFTLN